MLRKILPSLVLVLTAGWCGAQDFPSQPIRIVIPYAPGGGSDILARPIGVDMTQRLKRPVLVEKPTSSGSGSNTCAVMPMRGISMRCL